MNFQPFPVILASCLATAMSSLPAQAERPARLSTDERAAIQVAAASARDGLAVAAAGTKELLEADQKASTDANASIRAFLAQAALTTIAIEDAPAAGANVPAAQPLEVKAGPGDTIISADDGMYLDAEKGLLVYLKNVRLTSPDFDLSGADELKVFLGKKEEKPKEKDKDKDKDKETNVEKNKDPVDPAPPKDDKKKTAAPGLLGATGGFGDPEKIIAIGAVKITQKAVGGKPPVVASAGILTYDTKTGEIILKGRYPWVQQGSTFMRAEEPDLYLRIKKDGSFVTEGRWKMGGQLNPSLAAPKPALKPAPKPANP